MTSSSSSFFARLRGRRTSFRVAAAAGALVTAAGVAGVAVAAPDNAEAPTPVTADQTQGNDDSLDDVDVPELHDAIVNVEDPEDEAGDDSGQGEEAEDAAD